MRPNTIDVEEYGAVDLAPNFEVVLAKCFAEAKARGRAEIRIPPGRFKLSDTCTLLSPLEDNDSIRIIGSGIGTKIQNLMGDRHWIQIGPTGPSLTLDGDNDIGNMTANIVVEDMMFQRIADMANGSVFNVRNARHCQWRGVVWYGVGQAIRFGAADIVGGTGPTLSNDSVFFDLVDCSMSGHRPSALKPMIELGSGGSLAILGSRLPRYSGTDKGYQSLIQQTGVFHWDGLWVSDLIGSDWQIYLRSTEGGLVNVLWRGGQVDGAIKAFWAGVCGNGGRGNRLWQISDVQMITGETVEKATALDWNGNGVLHMSNCYLDGHSQGLIIRGGPSPAADSGSVFLYGIAFDGVGHNTTYASGPLIDFSATYGMIQGCSYIPRAGLAHPSAAVKWGGLAAQGRKGPPASPTGTNDPQNAFRGLPVVGSI